MGTVIYRAEEPHNCPDHGCRGLPVGSAVRCGVCGEVAVVAHDDFFGKHWRPLNPWPYDRAIRKAMKGGSDG